jgi:hypothetical protein
MIPAPRPASGPPLRPAPSRLPWPQVRAACRQVTGDALLLQYTLQKCSVRSMTELTVRKAREMLTAWATEHDAVDSRRDQVVQAAIDAGLSKSEVHRLTGIARTTIDRIVGAVPAMEADPR